MNTFRSVLQKFDETLRKYNKPNYDLLRPPLPPEEVAHKMAQLGLADEQLKAWFGWKTGAMPSDYDPGAEEVRTVFYRSAGPLSLDSILLHQKTSQAGSWWESHFVPIAADGGGLYLLFNSMPGENYGRIYLFCPSLLVIDPEICYDSLQTLLETTIAACEQGIAYYDEEQEDLDFDSKKYRKLAAKMNSHTEYFKEG